MIKHIKSNLEYNTSRYLQNPVENSTFSLIYYEHNCNISTLYTKHIWVGADKSCTIYRASWLSEYYRPGKTMVLSRCSNEQRKKQEKIAASKSNFLLCKLFLKPIRNEWFFFGNIDEWNILRLKNNIKMRKKN